MPVRSHGLSDEDIAAFRREIDGIKKVANGCTEVRDCDAPRVFNGQSSCPKFPSIESDAMRRVTRVTKQQRS